MLRHNKVISKDTTLGLKELYLSNRQNEEAAPEVNIPNANLAFHTKQNVHHVGGSWKFFVLNITKLWGRINSWEGYAMTQIWSTKTKYFGGFFYEYWEDENVVTFEGLNLDSTVPVRDMLLKEFIRWCVGWSFFLFTLTCIKSFTLASVPDNHSLWLYAPPSGSLLISAQKATTVHAFLITQPHLIT